MSINIAAGALTTNQAVMQVIGNNIANANTDGYTRQRVELQAVPGQQLGSGYFGKGVQIESVSRVGYDAFLSRESNIAQTAMKADSVRYQYLQNIESLFPMGEGGLGELLNNALNAWADVASSPNDSTARQVVLNQFDALATRIRETYERLNQIGESARLQAGETVKEVNRLAAAIAEANDKIAQVQGSGVTPNDLLDQRDLLVAKLNEKIKINTIEADDGTLSVFVAGSLPLVLGSRTAKLQIERADVDGDRQIKLSFLQGASSYEVPFEFVGGGELKGLHEIINKDVVSTQAALGQVSLALASIVNQQQVSGLNQNGLPGSPLFTWSEIRGLSINGASGGAVAIVSVPDRMPSTDIVVTFQIDGTLMVERPSDGLILQSDGSWAENVTSLSNDAAGVGSVLGLTFNFSGVPEASFYFRAGADVAQSISMSLAAPSELAAASRVSLSSVESNKGDASVQSVVTSLVSGSWGLPQLPRFLVFNGPDQFSLGPEFDPPSLTYTPGRPLVFSYMNGSDVVEIKINMRGNPESGDVFILDDMSVDGVRYSNGNARAMLDLRDQVVFDNSITLSDLYVSIFSNLASRVNEAKTRNEFSQALAADAEQRRANQAGVNLDEEAARLLQFQQAYQASAKYLQTVQSIFDSFISVFR